MLGIISRKLPVLVCDVKYYSSKVALEDVNKHSPDVCTSVVKLRTNHHGNMAGVSQTGPENKRGLIPCKASEAVKDVK